MAAKKRTGLGIIEIVMIVFLILKIAGAVTWSWGWVLAPVFVEVGVLLSYLALKASKKEKENK